MMIVEKTSMGWDLGFFVNFEEYVRLVEVGYLDEDSGKGRGFLVV